MKKNYQTDQLLRARRLRAAGCQIHIPEDDGDARHIPSDGLGVKQTGGVIESTAFDWGGGTAYKIYLVITSGIAGLAISHFELMLPWTKEGSLVQWLEDPVVIDGPSRCYRFMGNEILEFERSLVLNHRLDVTHPFSLGESARGFLLGFGSDPIPEDFSHGKMILAFLLLYDQFNREFRAPVKLWADRMNKKRRGIALGVRRKGGLFDKRDTIV
jgi:hypothetical protein